MTYKMSQFIYDELSQNFTGRESELEAMEEFLDDPKSLVMLIHGQSGIGKTSLVRKFPVWLSDRTEKQMPSFWLPFPETRSTEYLLNTIGSTLFSPNFLNYPIDEKLKVLASKLYINPHLFIFDNFETTLGIDESEIKPLLSEKDCLNLRKFFYFLRESGSKIIITSRRLEKWIMSDADKVINLEGLKGEDLENFVSYIIGDTDQQPDPPFDKQLIEQLNGNPLLIQMIIPKLKDKNAADILADYYIRLNELKTNAPFEDENLSQPLYAFIRMIEQELSSDMKMLLVPLAFHESYVDINHFSAIVSAVSNNKKVEELFNFLSENALMRRIQGKSNQYKIHPIWTEYLRRIVLRCSTKKNTDYWAEIFVDMYARISEHLNMLNVSEQAYWFYLHAQNCRYAILEAQRLDMYTHMASIVQCMAFFSKNTGNINEAELLFQMLTKIQKIRRSEPDEAKAYYNLGRVYQTLKEFQEAERCYHRAFKTFKKYNAIMNISGVSYQLGCIYQEQNKFEESHRCFDKALNIYTAVGAEPDAADICFQLGGLERKRNNLEMAEEWYKRALAIGEENNMDELIALSSGQLGKLAYERNDYKVAIDFFNQALEIFEDSKDDNNLILVYKYLGLITQQLREYNLAVDYFNKAIDIYEKNDDYLGIAYLVFRNAMIASELSQYERAEKLFNHAIKVNTKLCKTEALPEILYHFGMLYGLQGKFEDAGEKFIEAIQYLQQHKSKELLEGAACSFVLTYNNCADETKSKLQSCWEKKIGTFPRTVQVQSN